MKTICCGNEKLPRRRQVTLGASRPILSFSLSVWLRFFFSFGRNPTIRFTSVAQALDLFPRQEKNEKKNPLVNIVSKKTLNKTDTA